MTALSSSRRAMLSMLVAMGLTLAFAAGVASAGSLGEVAELDAPTSGTGLFSVAASGDLVVAGAPTAPIGLENGEAHTGRGQVFAFVRPAGGWSGTLEPTAVLDPSHGAARDFFGDPVAAAGSTVVAGVGNGSSLYVFTKPPRGWIGELHQASTLRASDGSASEDPPSSALS